MDYETIASLYLRPLADPITPPNVPTTPARRLRDALEPVATQGWWSREAYDRYNDLGLGFFDAYVWGRAASLGTPPAAVVVATFGVFEPTFLASVYEAGRGATSREKILTAREDGASASLRRLLGDEIAVGRVADDLLAALANLDCTARPLYAGLLALPVPSNPHGRLWRAAELVREHRGDGHLAACIAAGLGPVTMTLLTELWLGYPAGQYLSSRGYGPEHQANAMKELQSRGWISSSGELTDAGIQARREIEQATDESQDALIGGLGGGLDSIITATSTWSERVIDGGSFPTDPRKRAAG